MHGLSFTYCLSAGIWKPHSRPIGCKERCAWRQAGVNCAVVPCTVWLPLLLMGHEGSPWFWVFLSSSHRAQVNGGSPTDWLQLASKRDSRSMKQSISGGGKTGRGESLIQLGRRECFPIKENELRVAGEGGEGRKTLLEGKKEKKNQVVFGGADLPIAER